MVYAQYPVYNFEGLLVPLYVYEAFLRDGKKIRGTLDAPTMADARQRLIKQGLFLSSLSAVKDEQRFGFLQRLFMGKVKEKEKILFTKQLAVLLRSGVPLLQSMDLLIDQFKGRMKSILVSVRDDLKEGTSLAAGLQKYPRVFDSIFVQLVRAGEASGNLEVILERLTEYLERQQVIKSKLREALRYPIIQLFFVGAIVIALMTFVVPKIAKQFTARGQQLPSTTQLLISISDFFVNHYLLLIGIMIAFIGSIIYFLSTKTGKLFFDKLKLRLPLVKYLARTNAVVQFSYTFGLLIEGGVNIPEALDIVVKTVNNSILAKALDEARENIIKQGKIAQYLKQTNIFPPIAIHLLQTGEQTDKLGEMLLTIAHNYEVEALDLIAALTTALNPIMMVVMALIVGFIVLAIVPIVIPQGF